jgi:hypothetical protein
MANSRQFLNSPPKILITTTPIRREIGIRGGRLRVGQHLDVAGIGSEPRAAQNAPAERSDLLLFLFFTLKRR